MFPVPRKERYATTTRNHVDQSFPAVLFAIYSGGRRIKPPWRGEDIQRLRQQLIAARLRFPVCQSDASKVKVPHLFDTPAAAKQAMADDSGQLGVVLVDAPAD